MSHGLFLAWTVAVIGVLSAGQDRTIHQAVQAGDLAAVRATVEKDGSLVNAKDEMGRTPLHWAARGTNAAVEGLLGKCVRDPGSTAERREMTCSRDRARAAGALRWRWR
jgi:hypothetical protein